jgi:hypothetical protein
MGATRARQGLTTEGAAHLTQSIEALGTMAGQVQSLVEALHLDPLYLDGPVALTTLAKELEARGVAVSYRALCYYARHPDPAIRLPLVYLPAVRGTGSQARQTTSRRLLLQWIARWVATESPDLTRARRALGLDHPAH